jgi:hypothetical protein
MRHWIKKILKSDLVQGVVTALGALYIWIVYVTSRWEVKGGEIPQAYWKENKPFILSFWHGRLLMMPFVWSRAHPFYMLISSHKDGQLIAKIVSYYGIKTIYGSTSKGGTQALRHLLKALKAGGSMGITPDGPRGPRERVGGSVIPIAMAAGVDVIPVTYATSRRKILNTWDGFHLAFPFSRGVFLWGDPLPLKTKDKQGHHWEKVLEDRLNDLQVAAEAYVDQPTPKDPKKGRGFFS